MLDIFGTLVHLIQFYIPGISALTILVVLSGLQLLVWTASFSNLVENGKEVAMVSI